MNYSVNGIGTTGYSQGKDKSRFLSLTIHKNKFKIYRRPMCEMQNLKPLEKKYPYDISLMQIS